MEQQTTILPTLPPGAHLVTSDVVRTRLEGSEYQTEGLYANGRRECAYHIRHYRRHGGRVVTQEHGACWAFYYDGDAAKPLMVLTLNRELR